MRNSITLGLTTFFIFLIFFSCKKDVFVVAEDSSPKEFVETYSKNDGAEQFAIAQNYLMRTMTYALQVALLSPQMHGLIGDSQVETRSCPNITGPFSNTADGSSK